jgi:hypothetical protein
MNFKEILNLFNEGKATAKSHIKNLIEIAAADGKSFQKRKHFWNPSQNEITSPKNKLIVFAKIRIRWYSKFQKMKPKISPIVRPCSHDVGGTKIFTGRKYGFVNYLRQNLAIEKI